MTEETYYPRCEECWYWQERAENSGKCRLKPPVVANFRIGVVTQWPETHRNDWCGGWFSKKDHIEFVKEMRRVSRETFKEVTR